MALGPCPGCGSLIVVALRDFCVACEKIARFRW